MNQFAGGDAFLSLIYGMTLRTRDASLSDAIKCSHHALSHGDDLFTSLMHKRCLGGCIGSADPKQISPS
eukprot:scaffold165955_cov17-Prasinocladus_malaysianus.AAC.1